jgi:hypothetical protein
VAEVPIVIPAPNTRGKSLPSKVDVSENRIIPTRICIPITLETINDSTNGVPASAINSNKEEVEISTKYAWLSRCLIRIERTCILLLPFSFTGLTLAQFETAMSSKKPHLSISRKCLLSWGVHQSEVDW